MSFFHEQYSYNICEYLPTEKKCWDDDQKILKGETFGCLFILIRWLLFKGTASVI